MQALEHPPDPTEFTDVIEYKSSTPVTFALNEVPVLILQTPVIVSGYLEGTAEIWVTSSALFLLFPDKTYSIQYPGILFHAKDSEKKVVYLQGEFGTSPNDELAVKPLDGRVTRLYEAIDEAVEMQAVQEHSEDDGCSIHEDSVDLESGQGDDEIIGGAAPRLPASAAVQIQILGKRRRDDD